MKKLVSVILIVFMLASMNLFNVFAAEEIKVTIDGKNQVYDVMPVIENGRTLVPMRGIFEALGANITWDDASKTITGKKDDIYIIITIGKNIAKAGNKEVTLDTPAKIISDRTMVPVRFIAESLGCNVEWEDVTKTVIINTSSSYLKASVKPLVSSFHRPVPTEFEKSNDLNDLHYFLEPDNSKNEEMYEKVKSQGEIVCTTDKFLEKYNEQNSEYGKGEVLLSEGNKSNKSLKLTCVKVPENSGSLIFKTKATPEKNPGDGVNGKDIMLLTFRARCLSGGDENGNGLIQVQVEHPSTFKKACFTKAIISKDWKIFYMPVTGVDDATAIGVRYGFYEQEIELDDIEIINMGENFDVNTLPKTIEYLDEFKDGQQWRKDANERIEKIRKGNFSIIVKDKDGNPIKDANVTLDMFEHAFEFGTSINSPIYKNEEYAKKFSRLFNASVVEHHTKWTPYEENPAEAKKQIDTAISLGSKYNRGHVLFWEVKPSSSNAAPKKYYSDEIKAGNMEALEKVCREHIENIAGDFKEIFHEWDVINETVKQTFHRDIFGPEIYKKYFEWTRDVVGKDCKLYYNEGVYFFEDRVKELIEMGADFDALGIQSHYDDTSMTPLKLLDIYASLSKYGKEMKVTEFSCGTYDENLQANYMRDILICAFAEEKMNGFLMWSFWDGKSYAATAPIYSLDWTLKPAGKVYEDLVYNKWWTRNAKATTNDDGNAVINGFYGDYDVTVEANGKTVTKMVSFHKGYENVLEIVIE